IARVKEAGLTLTVCPLSNLSLCVVDDLKDHPMKHMLDLGLKATINSDDPAYFGGYVNQNYRETVAAVGLSADDIVTLARNSFTGSFLTSEEQARHLKDIDKVAATLA
ncbi:MAG: adenosine deaminase, partial [Pseudomonadota bacterium]